MKLKKRHGLIAFSILSLIISGSIFSSASGSNELIFYDGFEGSFPGKWQFSGVQSHTASKSDIPVLAGNKSYVAITKPGSQALGRTEIEIPAVPIEFHNEYWLGINTYVNQYEKPYPAMSTLIQFHAAPGQLSNGDPDWFGAQCGKNPLTITTANSQYGVQINTEPDEFAQQSAAGTPVWSEPLTLKKWVQWTIRIIPSPDGDGVAEVWKDGKKVASHFGPNMDKHDSKGRPLSPYVALKLGSYHWAAPTGTTQTLFYDEVKIAKGQNGYATVQAGQTNTDIAPPTGGDESDTTNPGTGKAPGEPVNVSAVPGNGKATVYFKAPSDNGGSSINGYNVVCEPDGKFVTVKQSPAVIDGLTNGKEYTFKIVAANKYGNSTMVTSSPVTPSENAVDTSNPVVDTNTPSTPTDITRTTTTPVDPSQPVVYNPSKVATTPQTVTSSGVNLSDIQGHWAEKDIQNLVSVGAVKGDPSGKFLPEGKVTRAEFVTMLTKALKLSNPGINSFKDSYGHWANEGIQLAIGNNIISGFEDGTFRPDEKITREQIAFMLQNAKKYQFTGDLALNFKDKQSVSPWAYNSLCLLHEKKIIAGFEDETIRPQNMASRAEAVSMISRCLN